MSNKYLITQSLLSNFDYRFSKQGFSNFVKSLKREKTETTFYMSNGISFETLVNNYLTNKEIDKFDDRMNMAIEVANIVGECEIQVKKSKELTVDNIVFVLYGIADFVTSDTIYDCKFVKSYSKGKYRNSPQHRMYFELFQDKDVFIYVICDGKNIYLEKYNRFETENISVKISNFITYLKERNMVQYYFDNWKSLY